MEARPSLGRNAYELKLNKTPGYHRDNPVNTLLTTQFKENLPFYVRSKWNFPFFPIFEIFIFCTKKILSSYNFKKLYYFIPIQRQIWS